MKTSKGGSAHLGPLRSPMAKDSNGLIKKGSLRPKVADNTMRPEIPVAGARVRSAQTAGKVVNPF